MRNEEDMRTGLAKIAWAKQKLETIKPRTTNERRLKLDLESAAFAVRAVLTASIGRYESRDSFLRSDFSDEDNANQKKLLPDI